MSNLAFEIGFDHYLFKLPLDIARFSDEHRRQIRYGLFMKWIQLKPNNLHFTISFTYHYDLMLNGEVFLC